MGVRKLPYSFNYTDPFGSKENDCEFVVDAIVEGKEDVFPVKDVAIQGRKVVRKCMVEGVQGRETVGAEAVGPKRGIVVVLLKRLGVDADEEEGLSGSLKVLNGNGERLLPLFNASRARARLIGDV